MIYAPLHQAPVVQVRVLYHVGSRDERPDRQGFAHMFEHMMFRGSRHVPPQEHMKLIDQVGGICNAFTSFDQTVYHDTVPAEDLDLALYLEADRMASFKVSDAIYQTERKVVAQEWMLQQNRAYGNLFTDLFKTAFKTSSYQWTPIGNMQQLLAAPAADLQEFFNTYYVPNNAVLVIAGDVDVPAARKLVSEYYAWIPAGAPVPTRTRTSRRRRPSGRPPCPTGWPACRPSWSATTCPPYKSDDQYALSVLAAVLGEGASSRLERALVNNDHPLCGGASTLDESLEYGGVFGVEAEVLPGQDVAAVKRVIAEQVADLVAHGVTPAELARAKTDRRVEAIHGRETAAEIAGQVGDEALWAERPRPGQHRPGQARRRHRRRRAGRGPRVPAADPGDRADGRARPDRHPHPQDGRRHGPDEGGRRRPQHAADPGPRRDLPRRLPRAPAAPARPARPPTSTWAATRPSTASTWSS